MFLENGPLCAYSQVNYIRGNRTDISSLKYHLPPVFSFFGSPKGMPPKKEKRQQSAIVLTIAKACSEKFLYHFSELSKFATFVGVFGQNFGELFD